MVAYICVVASWWFLTLILKSSLDKPPSSIPFKIEPPIIDTTFLFAIFLYIWSWSNFLSSLNLLYISLHLRIFTLGSKVLIISLCYSNYLWVLLASLILCLDLLFVFLEMLYLCSCVNKEKCLVCPATFLLILILLYFIYHICSSAVLWPNFTTHS